MIKRLALVTLVMLSSDAAFANSVRLQIATIAPENSAWVQGMRKSADLIAERTEGRVKFTLFPGGIQGSDNQVMQKIKRGRLHGAAFTPNVLRKEYKDIILYSLPMVFDSDAEADYVRSRLDQKLMDGLEEAGYVGFGFSATGFSVVLSDVPVNGLEDLRSKKIWAPEDDPISESALRALGLNPVPLSLGDVYTALQTGLIDIMPGSATGAVLMQWFTAVNYFTDLPLVYTVGLFVIDKRRFDRILPEDQAVVREVLTEFTAELNAQSPANEAGAKDAMVAKGVKRIVPDPVKMAEIREAVLASNRQLAEQGEFSMELFEEMLRYIDEYRSEANEADGADSDAAEQEAEVSRVESQGAGSAVAGR